MKRFSTEKRIYMMVMTALMMALILVATSLFKVPVPMTQGYVHLGDAMIFLSVLVLGKKNGAMAAGLGSALGDILGGYAMWAPWTFVIKFLMAFLMGLFIDLLERRPHGKETSLAATDDGNRGVTLLEVFGMLIGGAEMCAGYFLAERFLYGNWAVAALAIPWNIGQFALGAVVCVIIAQALYKTPVRKYMLGK